MGWLLQEKDAPLLEDRKDADLSDNMRIPNTKALAESMRSCLQEHDELPKDFQRLFNDSLFKFDTNLIPEAVALYEQIGVKHEPLSLIPPQFECPLPPLNPAVFPPALRELPPPALDQYDLDEHFASPRQRLAQLTNKCTSNDDLAFFVKESGEILGVTSNLSEGNNSAKHILHFIFEELVKFKSVNQEGPAVSQVAASSRSADGGTGLINGSVTGMGIDSRYVAVIGEEKRSIGLGAEDQRNFDRLEFSGGFSHK